MALSGRAIGDVPVAEHGGRHQGAVSDPHPVVHLVAFLQAAQDRDRVFHGRLIHHHLLETTLQRRVLFDVLAVFVKGGGADATQFATGQHRLEQVAGIHGSTAGSCSHHGVDLVDEQHDLPFGCRHLLHRLSRSSNSPRYLAPAIRAFMSSAIS